MLSATFTINTDFSMAEVDEQQVALDRFSLFFPEKRDFFLQDARVFEFGDIDANGRPFFSRRIGLGDAGQPIGLAGGAKLTGRVDDYNIGALAIRQETHGDIDATDLFVIRGSRNILEESAIGFVMTHSDPTSNDNNSLFGVDLLYRNSDGPFGQIFKGTFWAQQSDSPTLDDENRAFGASLEIRSDKLSAEVTAQEIQENFHPALEFVNRTGIRRFETELRYGTRPKTGRWPEINHRIEYTLVTDMDGATLSEETRIRPVSLYFHRDDFLFIEWKRNKESVLDGFDLFGRLNVPAGSYKFDRYRAEIATGMQRALRVVLSVQDGGFFGGDRLEKFVELLWRQSAHFFWGSASPRTTSCCRVVASRPT